MRVGEALRLASRNLAEAGIQDASLEAEVLLRHLLGVDRAHLYSALNDRLPVATCQAYALLLERRLRHEPSAYIVGHKEFYGSDLQVDPRVLIPRPETELLVDCALEWAGRRVQQARPSCTIVDVGTGSGAIAIALAQNLPEATVFVTDISADALEVARANCLRHGVGERVTLLRGDLLLLLGQPMDLIVSNLPYVKTSQIDGLDAEIREFEPRLALDGGEDGLDVIGRLLLSARASLNQGGAILLEIGEGQGSKATQMARDSFPGASVSLSTDLAGIDRVLRIETV